jgi:hypothetical protein
MILATVGGICVLAVGLLPHSVVRPWLDRYFLELEELAKHDPLAANQSLLDLIAPIMAVSSSLAFGIGLWTIHTGWQMARAEQWPPPGMKVYRRVKILDRTSARRRGIVLIGVGLILAILVPAMGWKAYRGISTLFDAPRADNRLQHSA